MCEFNGFMGLCRVTGRQFASGTGVFWARCPGRSAPDAERSGSGETPRGQHGSGRRLGRTCESHDLSSANDYDLNLDISSYGVCGVQELSAVRVAGFAQ